MAERPSLLRLTAQVADPDGSVETLIHTLLPVGVDVVHHYTPQGVSWVRLGAGARVTVHTWPEHELATVDTLGLPEVQVLAALSTHAWCVVQAHR